MRRLLTVGLLAVTALLPAPACAAETPPFDIDAALEHLATTRVYATPGAIARLAPGAALGDVKVLITPPRSLDAPSGGDFPVYDTVSTWSRDHHVDVVLVTGVLTTLISGGQAVPSDVVSARDQLGKDDITDLVEFLAKVSEHPAYRDPAGEITPDDSVPAPAALVTTVGDALAKQSTYVAPGLSDEAGDPRTWSGLLHGKAVRVAVLPPAAAHAPWPDVLTPLHARFPNDEVIVVRGHYLEAAGSPAGFDTSAADYLLGTYEDILAGRELHASNIVNLFLKRLGILRDGVAFSRQPVYPPSVRHLLVRAAPTTGLVVAALLALGTVLSVLLARRRTSETGIDDVDRLRAEVFASLSALNAKIIESPHGADVSRAAERQSEALDLWDEAQEDRDPEVLQAASDAVDEALVLLAGGRR